MEAVKNSAGALESLIREGAKALIDRLEYANARSIHTRWWIEYFANEHAIDLITLSYTKKEDD